MWINKNKILSTDIFNIVPSSAPSIDPDAQAFITAANITNNTQINAINTLVISLKAANIWTKFVAIYPICGGVASSHAVNLKTPGTYNLTFTTGWTHTNLGMTPATAYANTNMFPSVALTNINSHMSYYSRTNSGISAWEFGACSNTNNDNFYMQFNGSNYLINIQGGNVSGSLGSINGCFLNGSMLSGTQTSSYRNGNLLLTNPVGTLYGLPTNARIYLGAASYGNAVNAYGFRQCAFSSVGQGFTSGEALSFYNAVQTYQTTLGRQV